MAKRREFNVIIEQDSDGYYVGSVSELPGCHTQAKSVDILVKRIKEAIELCLEVQEDSIKHLPRFIGLQKVIV